MIVHGETDRDTAERTAKSLGIPLAEARHLLAIARGEVAGNYAVAEGFAAPANPHQRSKLPRAARKSIAKPGKVELV